MLILLNEMKSKDYIISFHNSKWIMEIVIQTKWSNLI